MNDAQLEKLTVKELTELRAEIEVAIRAAIRAKNSSKLGRDKIDLERERDAWLSTKRSTYNGVIPGSHKR